MLLKVISFFVYKKDKMYVFLYPKCYDKVAEKIPLSGWPSDLIKGVCWEREESEGHLGVRT